MFRGNLCNVQFGIVRSPAGISFHREFTVLFFCRENLGTDAFCSVIYPYGFVRRTFPGMDDKSFTVRRCGYPQILHTIRVCPQLYISPDPAGTFTSRARSQSGYRPPHVSGKPMIGYGKCNSVFSCSQYPLRHRKTERRGISFMPSQICPIHPCRYGILRAADV